MVHRDNIDVSLPLESRQVFGSEPTIMQRRSHQYRGGPGVPESLQIAPVPDAAADNPLDGWILANKLLKKVECPQSPVRTNSREIEQDHRSHANFNGPLC
jgi:hypothetical protein